MENKILIFNMKTYMDINDIIAYQKELPNLPSNVIICPEMLYVPYFLKKYNIALQNAYFDGTYTGEVTLRHMKKMGINSVVIGHSERRVYFRETDELINKKVIEATEQESKVILCIGDTLEDKQNNKVKEKLAKQLSVALENVNKFNIIIAYEPVWAIGTGKVPENSEIADNVSYIKQYIKDNYNEDLKVVYGGSINSSNIASLNKIDNVDGFMIGKSSTIVNEVKKMIEVVSS